MESKCSNFNNKHSVLRNSVAVVMYLGTLMWSQNNNKKVNFFLLLWDQLLRTLFFYIALLCLFDTKQTNSVHYRKQLFLHQIKNLTFFTHIKIIYPSFLKIDKHAKSTSSYSTASRNSIPHIVSQKLHVLQDTNLFHYSSSYTFSNLPIQMKLKAHWCLKNKQILQSLNANCVRSTVPP